MNKINVVTLTCLSIAFLTFISINACRKGMDAAYEGSDGNAALQTINSNNTKPLSVDNAEAPPLVVSPDEYASADAFTQKMIDATQAAVDQLFTQGADGDVASFTFYDNGQSSAIVINGMLYPDDAVAKITCDACSRVERTGCFFKFEKYMRDNHLATVKLVAKRQGKCVKITLIPAAGSGPGGFPPLTRPDTLPVFDTTGIITVP